MNKPLLLLIGAAIVCAVNDSADLPPSGKPPWCNACQYPHKHAECNPSGLNCRNNPANQYVEVCRLCGENCCCVCQQCKDPHKKMAHKFTNNSCKKWHGARKLLQPGETPDVLEFEQGGKKDCIQNPKVLNRKPAGSKAKPPPPTPHSSAPATVQNTRKRVRAAEGQRESHRPKRLKTNPKEQHAIVQVVHPELDSEPEAEYIFEGLPYNELHPGERPWSRHPPRPHQDSRVSIAHHEVAAFLSAIRARLYQSSDLEPTNDRLSWALWFWNLQREMQTTDILYAIDQYVQGNVQRAFLKRSREQAREELMSVLHDAWNTLWQSFVTNHDVIENGGDAPSHEADLAHVTVQQQIRDSLSWLIHFGPPGYVRAGIRQRRSDELNQVPHIRGPDRFEIWYERMMHLAPEETRFLSCRHWFPPQHENTTAHPTTVGLQRIPPEETEIPLTGSPLASNVEDGLFTLNFGNRVCSMHAASDDMTQEKRKAQSKEQAEEAAEEAAELEEPSEQPKASMA